MGGNTDLNNLNAELSEKKSAYAALVKKYSDAHPDVLALKKQIETIQAAMFAAKNEDERITLVEPDNPAYITMKSQLESVTTELKSVKYTRDKMRKKIAELTELIRKAPLVEKEYMDMLQELDNTNMRYRDVSAREMEADISQHLEVERKGERFTLIDPPQEPLEPVSPNRPAILFLGLILAIGAGVGLVAVKEAMGVSIYNEAAIAGILGTTPLANIPYLENLHEFEVAKRNRNIGFISVAVIGVFLVGVFHFAFMPLDVFWYKLLRVVNL